MELAIAPRCAAIPAVLFVALSLAVVRTRREQKVAIGVSAEGGLDGRVRVHGNFAECAPFALLLLAMAEFRRVPPVLHAPCLSLLLGRVSHAWGVSRPDEDHRFRVAGVALTFAAIAGAALVLLPG